MVTCYGSDKKNNSNSVPLFTFPLSKYIQNGAWVYGKKCGFSEFKTVE